MKTTIRKGMMLVLGYYIVMLAACIKDKCNCPPVKDGKFSYTDLEATNMLFTLQSDTAFSSTVSTADTIMADRFGIRFRMGYKILACTTPRKNAWINSAYACDCAFSQFYIVDSITGISIRTLRDLDAAHPAGSDVGAYFKALEYSYTPQKIVYYDALSPGQYNGPQDPGMTGTLQRDLYLKAPISGGREVAFEISFTFASGNKLSAQTKPVFLK